MNPLKEKLIFEKLKNIFYIQMIFILYTFVGITAKKASTYSFLSNGYIKFYIIEIFLLGIFALFWQQIIKKFSLSVAYSNKGLSIIWSLLWSYIIFHERITINNVIGALVIIIGIIMVNKNE